MSSIVSPLQRIRIHHRIGSSSRYWIVELGPPSDSHSLDDFRIAHHLLLERTGPRRERRLPSSQHLLEERHHLSFTQVRNYLETVRLEKCDEENRS